MAEVLDVINAFGNPLKVAWVVWLAWGVGQYFWYRHDRAGVVRPKAAPAPRPVVRKTAPVKHAEPSVETPITGRLITPHHVAPDPKVAKVPNVADAPAQYEVPAAHEAPAFFGQSPAPAFDPSKAVIETFSAMNDSALDKFVAEFERQDANPRRRRTIPSEASSFGAEAPHVP